MNLVSTPAPMNTPRTLHTLTRFAGGFILACGGLDADGNVLATAELYNPATGTWTTLSGQFNTPRYGHAAVATANGALLLIGGQTTGGGFLASVELFTIPFGGPPTAGTFTTVSKGLQSARANMAVELLAGGGILITGGADSGDAALALAEVYTPGI
jgi:hypothetical protein